MTQKEKFEEAKRLYETANADQRYVLESLFPELKELNDENIRKELISIVTWSTSYSASGVTKEDANNLIAWLEKQAQKPAAWTEEDKNMLKWVIGYLENKMLNTPISEERIACKNAIAWLLEKQAQKPVDKVEPKFKVGDWISGYYTNYKVLSVNNNGYVVEDVDGNKINILFENEKFHHLWTIQDAKDGDVLVCESGWTCIFKKLNHNSFGEILFDSYCFIDRTGWFCDGAKGHTLNERINGKIYPATKEQRERLEKAMADAGYTFDFDKKKLKKIEDEPTELPKGEDYGINGLYAAIDILQKTLGKVDGYQSDDGILEHKCAISAVKKLYEQKSAAWSEEDDRNLQGIIDEIEANKNHAPDYDLATYNRFLSWLKDLKDRVQPQPKQEWSEEDEAHLIILDSICESSEAEYYDHPESLGKKAIINAKNWLKTLKDRVQPQPQWKPSDEQMNLLEELVEDNNQRYFYTILRSLYEQLKKLREE